MNPEDKKDQLASLEDPETEVVGAKKEGASLEPETNSDGTSASPKVELPKNKRFSFNFRLIFSRVNIYLLAFIFLFVIAVIALFISMRINDDADNNATIDTETLTAEELSKLRTTDAKVGDPKQTLTIESNTIINGKVLLRDDLDIAGTIRVGGALSLPGITVAGTSNFEQIQANSLLIAGDTAVQGRLTVQANLAVTGNASVGGSLSVGRLDVQTLQLNNDIQLNRHIDAGGSTPSKSDGNNLGSGGTVSVSGTDIAGTITINTGGGPSSGCFITVNFANRYNGTPHVVVSPVGAGGAGLNYYVTRTSSNFSLCTTNSPPAATSFSFDYIVIE